MTSIITETIRRFGDNPIDELAITPEMFDPRRVLGAWAEETLLPWGCQEVVKIS